MGDGEARRTAAGAGHGVTKTERWLNLLAFLLDHHYPVTREEILSQVEDYKSDWVGGGDEKTRESVRRKFERDKSDLKALGIAIGGRTVRRPPHPYFLPSVALDPSDLPVLRRAAERVAQLADTPLGAAARSALRKLSFDLPETDPGESERAFAAPTGPEFSRAFDALRRAVEESRAVSCRYYAIGRDRDQQRVIEPYGLMLSWGHWYCVGRARERNALRVFRVDRMKNVTPVDGKRGEFATPKDFRIGAYLNRAPWELSEEKPFTARVQFAFPQSRWVIGEGLGKVVKAVTDDAGAELEFEVRSADAFVRWLLPLGSHAEVLAPESLRERLATARRAIKQLYA